MHATAHTYLALNMRACTWIESVATDYAWPAFPLFCRYLNDFKVQLLRADGTGREKWKKVTLFVFSDVLVVAKPDKALFAKKGTLKYMNLIRWEELDFTSTVSAAAAGGKAAGSDGANLDLEFTATQASETNTTVTNYQVRCKDMAQKRKVEEQFGELTRNRTKRSSTLKKNQQVGLKQRKWGTQGTRVTWRRGQKKQAESEAEEGAAGGGTAGSHASGTYGTLEIFNRYKKESE